MSFGLCPQGQEMPGVPAAFILFGLRDMPEQFLGFFHDSSLDHLSLSHKMSRLSVRQNKAYGVYRFTVQGIPAVKRWAQCKDCGHKFVTMEEDEEIVEISS